MGFSHFILVRSLPVWVCVLLILGFLKHCFPRGTFLNVPFVKTVIYLLWSHSPFSHWMMCSRFILLRLSCLKLETEKFTLVYYVSRIWYVYMCHIYVLVYGDHSVNISVVNNWANKTEICNQGKEINRELSLKG